MSEQTCRVLYARYNPTRSPDFRVTTEICEDEGGLFVRKRAGESAARAHLERIRENSECLRDYYEGVQVIPCEWADGALRFPYIAGQTLAEQIDAEHLDKERFVAEVNERLERVLHVQQRFVTPFRPSPEFEAMFGRIELGEDVAALNPVNIDSQLSNFIENESGLYCIDCEWVCHFPVPLDYVRYRALRYLYRNQVQHQIKDIGLEEMLGWFGFQTQQLQIFQNMERCFLQHVHGEGCKYIYTERYRKPSVSLSKSRFGRRANPGGRLTEGIKRIARHNKTMYGVLRMAQAALRQGPGYALRNRKAFF